MNFINLMIFLPHFREESELCALILAESLRKQEDEFLKLKHFIIQSKYVIILKWVLKNNDFKSIFFD